MHTYRTTQIAPPALLTTTQVITRLGVTRNTLCLWVREKRLVAHRYPNGAYRFDPAVIEAWLEANNTK